MIVGRRDLLARAYLDMLAAEAGTNGKPMLRSGDENDPVELLIDDLSTAPDNAVRTSIRADLAAAAIMVARAIEGVDGLTRELRRGRPVVAIATLSADLVSLVGEVLETCSFGSDATVMDERSFGSRTNRPVLLMTRDGTGVDHKTERGNETIAKALHAGAPVVGIAPDTRRHLARDLLRAAEHHLSLGRPDASAIALVIEAVTGTKPTVAIDDELVRAVDISDLALSIRSDRDANQCVDRLQQVVSSKGEFEHSGPRLEELAGYGAARKWGLDLIADLAEYRAGLRAGPGAGLEWQCLEHSLLLVGPPGVGKTQYAKALAKSANIPLIATSVADWNSAPYLSGTLSAMKACFTRAKQLAPCILFIDELDGISDRATLAEYREIWSQILNLLLELLSSVEPGVVVVAATNYVDRIDPAVRRAGRLDRIIEIPLPDANDLARIFRYHLGGDVLRHVDLMPAALAAAGKSGADVEAWVRRAQSNARRERRAVKFDDVMLEIRSGRPGLPEKLRRSCAVHEAGHLVVGVALNVFEPKALTILDDGGATSVDLSHENGQSEEGIENFIASLLGGRAAELVVLGPSNATAGAGVGEASDFARATRAAMDLELKFGFGKLGVAQFCDRTTEMLLHDPAVVGLVKARLDRCLERARSLIAVNRKVVEAVADRLEETGYLDRAAIEKLLRAHPVATDAKDKLEPSADHNFTADL
jgi:hypothetical protein